jgi:hypothetical protein
MSLVRGLSRWLKLFGRLGARAEACAWENLAAVALANKTAGQHALGMGKSRRDSKWSESPHRLRSNARLHFIFMGRLRCISLGNHLRPRWRRAQVWDRKDRHPPAPAPFPGVACHRGGRALHVGEEISVGQCPEAQPCCERVPWPPRPGCCHWAGDGLCSTVQPTEPAYELS